MKDLDAETIFWVSVPIAIIVLLLVAFGNTAYSNYLETQQFLANPEEYRKVLQVQRGVVQ